MGRPPPPFSPLPPTQERSSAFPPLPFFFLGLANRLGNGFLFPPPHGSPPFVNAVNMGPFFPFSPRSGRENPPFSPREAGPCLSPLVRGAFFLPRLWRTSISKTIALSLFSLPAGDFPGRMERRLPFFFFFPLFFAEAYWDIASPLSLSFLRAGAHMSPVRSPFFFFRTFYGGMMGPPFPLGDKSKIVSFFLFSYPNGRPRNLPKPAKRQSFPPFPSLQRPLRHRHGGCTFPPPPFFPFLARFGPDLFARLFSPFSDPGFHELTPFFSWQ